jgi:protein tyrosine/serine phosphatase
MDFVCKTCGQLKEEIEFYRNKNSKSGFTSSCRACIKEKVKQRNRQPSSEEQKIWDRRRKLKTFGLTTQDYMNMYSEQKGCCAICKEPKEILCVDHCHTTNRVRGLLCNNCNFALGLLKDSPEVIKNALEYLQNPREENLFNILMRL